MTVRTSTILVALPVLAACTGIESPAGIDEPLFVHGAVFKSGELPGTPPPDEPASAGERRHPLVTGFEPPTTVLFPGQIGKQLSGRTTDDAYSIAVRFADEGTGYWVLPLGAPDANYPGELGFRARFDLSPTLPPGEHVLQIVAIDARGVAGEQFEFPLCAVRPYDRSRNACDPTVRPPAAVISLTWDTDADLDLVVRTPSGKWVDANAPTTADPRGEQTPDLEAEGVGVLDRDSNAGCDIDSARRENLVFNHSPEQGPYLVYVNLFEACGRAAAHFTVESYVRVNGAEEGTYDIVPWQEPITGIVLGASANGGRDRGLFVGTIEFP